MNKYKVAEDSGYVLVNIWDWMNTVDMLLGLQYSKYFKIENRGCKLHYYKESTKDHIVSDDLIINDNLISLGYLPIYDDGRSIEFIY